MDLKVVEKFWKSIEKDDINGCWNWIGKLGKSGTPIIRQGTAPNNKEFLSRRIALEIAEKELPPAGHLIYEYCKNIICVNPDHLYWTDKDRFWSKVQKTNNINDCWLWSGCTISNQGYGRFENHPAHQYAYMYANNCAIPMGMIICHKCDVRSCCNPNHLFIGTNNDNMADMVAKLRACQGERHPLAKLTENDIREIRSSTLNSSELAQKFNVSSKHIRSIITRKVWNSIV